MDADNYYIPIDVGNLAETILKRAEKYDVDDPLASFASLFMKEEPSLVYLDGNSLGMLPVATKEHIRDVLEDEWGRGLIRSYNDKWWNGPSELGAMIAPLVGAGPDEVIVCDSVTVNLFKIVMSVLRDSRRNSIVSDELNFGTDLYIAQGVIDLLGGRHRLELMRSDDGITVSDKELKRLVNSDCALLSLSHVSFRSAFVYDMERVTRLAHDNGAMVLWDLSHAAGAVPVDLNGAGADFAVGCTYKYLNAGPGAVSFIYVRRDIQDKIGSPLWGWWADADPFSFNTDFTPAKGMKRFLTGSVPVLSSTTLRSSLEIFRLAGMDRIREKSVAMTSLFHSLFKEYLEPLGFAFGSPENPDLRGSHVSVKHPEAYRICKALADENEGEWTVIPDFRVPDNIRVGFAPLYNSFAEVAIAVAEMARIAGEGVYEKYSDERGVVT